MANSLWAKPETVFVSTTIQRYQVPSRDLCDDCAEKLYDLLVKQLKDF